MRRPLALLMAFSFLLHTTQASAQSIPEPPESLSMQRCPVGAEWHPIHGCGVRTTHWVLGPAWENILTSLAVVGVGYVLQLISTAISVSRGRDDVSLALSGRGPAYSQRQLNEYEEWGYAPLVGPWAKLALAPPHVDDSGNGVFAVEGVIQLLGTVLFVISLFTHEEEEWTPVSGRVQLTATSQGMGLAIPF